MEFVTPCVALRECRDLEERIAFWAQAGEYCGQHLNDQWRRVVLQSDDREKELAALQQAQVADVPDEPELHIGDTTGGQIFLCNTQVRF